MLTSVLSLTAISVNRYYIINHMKNENMNVRITSSYFTKTLTHVLTCMNSGIGQAKKSNYCNDCFYLVVQLPCCISNIVHLPLLGKECGRYQISISPFSASKSKLKMHRCTKRAKIENTTAAIRAHLISACFIGTSKCRISETEP